ncbi:hypothetical protein OAP56_03145 [Rickettsiaceae bacterium]|nr:hypothetical protein [Rickettsiaceae bacterium]
MKNANIDEMSIKELYKEVFKLRKGISFQQKKNMQERAKKFQQIAATQKNKGLEH